MRERKDPNASKTDMLNIINVLVLIGCILAGIFFIVNIFFDTFTGFMIIVSGIVFYAFTKGFINIIDLLTEINEKMK